MGKQQKVDVLAVLRRHEALAEEVASPEQVAEAREVRAAVAELIEAAKMARYSGCVNYLIPALVRLGQAHPADAAKYAALAALSEPQA